MKLKFAMTAVLVCCALIGAGCRHNTPKQVDLSSLPQAIQQTIKQKYPHATIVDYDKDASGYEVDIMDDNRRKEMKFGPRMDWMGTHWEVSANEVPAMIMDNLTSSAYKDFKIKEIDAIERPSGMYYTFELSHHGNDVHLTFNSTGQLIK